MAQLALGIAGAVVGSFFGAPQIGFIIGSTIGGIIFKPPAPDGPRVLDRKLQTSQYGKMIPLVWGRQRLAGEVIDQTDLVEHEHHSDGKGSSGPSSFTYTASFDVAICDVTIAGVLRIWADGRVIYDVTGSTTVDNSKVPVTFYLGTETQTVDPTFEAIHGVGNLSAYRGVAHAVFTDMELADFFNRIPNFEFEVYTSAGGIPWRVSTWTVPETALGASGQFPQASLANGVLTVGEYDKGALTYQQFTYDLQGNLLTSGDLVPLLGDSGAITPCGNDSTIAFVAIPGLGGGNPDASYWYVSGVVGSRPVTPPIGTDSFYSVVCEFVKHGEFLYVIGGGAGSGLWVARYPCPFGNPQSNPDLYYVFPAGSGNYSVTVGDDNCVYVLGPFGLTTVQLLKFDLDLNLLTTYNNAHFQPSLAAALADQFTVYQGNICIGHRTSDQCYAFSLSGSPFPTVGHIPGSGLATEPMTPLGNGYVITHNGIISLNPPAQQIRLSTIVGDLCVRGHLTSAQYDVSELVDLVTGFKITQQATLRTAVESLQPGYFFDALERDVLVAFPKRGKAAVVTIPADDLAAAEDGQEQPAPRDYTHGHDDDLPRRLWVVYQEEDADYQPGSQSAQRQTGNAVAEMSLELAVAMDANKARNIAEINLLQAHVERDRYAGSTSRKYLYLEPTDVVGLIDRSVRLTTKEHTPSGLLRWDGVRTVQPIYIATGTGAAGDGFSEPTATITQDTDLRLLDLPLVNDLDSPNGFYAAMAGKLSASWVGASLYKSSDGGASYASILNDSTADTFGTCSTTLGNYTGGNTFDETNSVTVVLTAGAGTLASATELALLNGANAAAVGISPNVEIIQFRVATLTATRTYVLSGLLRGRRGSEWMIGAHAAAENFVLLPTSINPPGASAELTLPRLYKAVTTGRALTTATAVSFTNTGVALKPYAPVLLGGGRNSAGDLTLQWTRRTRIGGSWTGFTTPLSEPFESYQALIYSDNTYTTIKRTLSVPIQTAVYDAASQTTDFGSPQATVYWGVQQLGSYFYGYEARAAT